MWGRADSGAVGLRRPSVFAVAAVRPAAGVSGTQSTLRRPPTRGLNAGWRSRPREVVAAPPSSRRCGSGASRRAEGAGAGSPGLASVKTLPVGWCWPVSAWSLVCDGSGVREPGREAETPPASRASHDDGPRGGLRRGRGGERREEPSETGSPGWAAQEPRSAFVLALEQICPLCLDLPQFV